MIATMAYDVPEDCDVIGIAVVLKSEAVAPPGKMIVIVHVMPRIGENGEKVIEPEKLTKIIRDMTTQFLSVGRMTVDKKETSH